MSFSKYAVALSALATTGTALAQSGGTLTYGPAAATAGTVATPVPLPSLFLLPLGIALAFFGYRSIKKNGAGSVLGVLLLALGVTAGVTSSLNIQKAIAAAMVELNQPAGGTVNIPAGDAIYTNTSGVALEIGTVVAPPSCATSAPADECISGLVLEDTQSCSTVYDCDQTISFTSTAPADATVGGATYAVTATSTSGLAVSFSTASSACSIAGSTVSFIAAGDCVIDADQAGDTDYNPAPQTSQAITARSLPVVTVTKKADGVEAETPTPGAFTISRTGGTTNLLTVNFVLTGTANGVAGTPSTPAVLTDDEDYTVSSLTQVEIPAGSSSVDVTITVLDDEVYDPTEEVILTLQADPAAYTLSASDATLEIAAMDKRIFVTAASFDGNLGGIGGADLKCNADTNKPGVGTYKAMIAGDRFRSAFPPVDWVLTAGTSYFRPADEVFIARALTDAVFTFPLKATIPPSTEYVDYERVWTGLRPDWTTEPGKLQCIGSGDEPWTSYDVYDDYYFMNYDGLRGLVDARPLDPQSPIAYSYDSCSNSNDTAGLYCVEQ